MTPDDIDYPTDSWRESCGHLPLRDRALEEVLLLHRHWIWANVQREAMEQEFTRQPELPEPGPLMMATKGVSFMLVWYGLLWSVIEACDKERRLTLRGDFRADLDATSDLLRRCRNAVLHVPKGNDLLDDRIADLVGGVSAIRIRRIHRGFGRLFAEEMMRRKANP